MWLFRVHVMDFDGFVSLEEPVEALVLGGGVEKSVVRAPGKIRPVVDQVIGPGLAHETGPLGPGQIMGGEPGRRRGIVRRDRQMRGKLDVGHGQEAVCIASSPLARRVLKKIRAAIGVWPGDVHPGEG